MAHFVPLEDEVNQLQRLAGPPDFAACDFPVCSEVGLENLHDGLRFGRLPADEDDKLAEVINWALQTGRTDDSSSNCRRIPSLWRSSETSLACD
jgi:hypothetical protein